MTNAKGWGGLPPNRPRFLTIEQVAEELNAKQPLVRALIKSGDLRAFQVGGRGMWRVGTKDLEDYIKQAYTVAAERMAEGDLEEI